jgi:DNA invertase Pin-like site-specific DNA recombinase
MTAEPTRPPRIVAAQYLRMSTDHQRYSMENQAAAIAAYAKRRGYRIAATYADEGKSGLRLANRMGLRQLLADTVDGSAAFEVILVYDVSRWGRFQNPDQSAHYEFLCREAGVRVEYCAETFENDGSLSSTLLKSLKRAMAAEFSRDLSVKVSAGRRRLTLKGYWTSGPPGLGLRRQTVDERGRRGPILEAGQRKAIQGHRTLLVPGPAHEVALVNRIYSLFLTTALPRCGIARLLNAEGATTDRGQRWTFTTVHSLLTNPKYVGDLVYHRTSSRLAGPAVCHPKSEWRVRRRAHAPIVERSVFDAAQEKIRVLRNRTDRDTMLDGLRQVAAEHGRVTGALIERTPGIPGARAYAKRFGGLSGARTAIGLAGRSPPVRHGPLSDDELLDCLSQLLHRHGYISATVMRRTAGMPATNTYQYRFGSLRAAFLRIGYVQMSARERRGPVGRARIAAALAANANFRIEAAPSPPARPGTEPGAEGG